MTTNLENILNRRVFYFKIILFLFISLIICSCEKAPTVPNDTGNEPAGYDNPDWTFSTHENASPDYALVFPQDSVNRIEISITAAQWTSIRANMKSLFGCDFGQNTNGGGRFPDTEADYTPVLLKFNGKSWNNAGFRLKGNSSLAQAWGEGIYKLPFKLNFDKFEDSYPAIKNQHFYGFEELSFSPAFRDQSLMRGKITADIFRLAGIPAARTAFYRVYIDFGSGLKYCGVYTAVELPDDSMVKDQFGENDGNIYKPESNLARFVQSEFDKKNNETAADYSDVQAFIDVLKSSIRTSDPAKWRSNLEAVFNVDHFIRYLALNNAIVNWDSYGSMAHNYYLYGHSTQKLTWIPWDHNEALTGSPGIAGTSSGSGPGGPGMNHNGMSLSMNEVSATWPLIRYVADDAIYMTRYKEHLKLVKDNVITESAMNDLVDRNYNLIEPFAIGANGEQRSYSYLTGTASFTSSLQDLKTHFSKRRALISSYVQ